MGGFVLSRLQDISDIAALTLAAGKGYIRNAGNTAWEVRPFALLDAVNWVTNAMLAGSITANKLVGTDIATVGTITVGTWHGTPIAAANLVGSDITTLGIVTVGTWSATPIAINAGGTGQISANAAFNALAPAQTTANGKYLKSDGTNTSWQMVPAALVGANPSVSVGLAVVNGAAATFMRSDAAPALDVSISPVWTGVHSHSTNGAASAPVVVLSGSWFSGGSTTSTKPQLLIEPATAASTGWNIGGTGLGVNSVASFGGNLIDAQKDGSSQFSVTSLGNVTAVGNYSTLTGYFRVANGATVAAFASTGLNLASSHIIGWTSTTDGTQTKDTGFARGSAGVVNVTAGAGAGSMSMLSLSLSGQANDIALGGFRITGAADPSAAQDYATKAYVDVTVQGLSPKPTATLATAAALAANTYVNGVLGAGATLTANANGALTVDGVVVIVGNLILVKNEVTSSHNGLYTVTAVGDGSHPYILTRHVDMDTSGEFSGAFIPVGNAGTANPNTLWLANPSGTVTVGTTAIPFTQLNSATSYTPGTGISISGSTISIDAAYVGQSSITTLGIITTGTWHGTAIAAANLVGSDITTVGTITVGTWHGTAIAAANLVGSDIATVGTITVGTWSATTIAINKGGTGQTTANAALNALIPSQTGNSGKFLTTNATDTSWATVTLPTGADPTASVGLTLVAGTATTFMRSDGAPPLLQTIAPTMTGKWVFGPTLSNSSGVGIGTDIAATMSTTSTGGWTALRVNPTQVSDTGSGTKLLQDWQLGGVSKASITTTGAATFSGAISASNLSGTNTGDQTAANPSASLGLTAVNGSATTFMRSDAAPALSVSIAPTWTGQHIFHPTIANSSGVSIAVDVNATMSATSTGGWTALRVNAQEVSDFGSGTKLIQDWQLQGASKANIDINGQFNCNNISGTNFLVLSIKPASGFNIGVNPFGVVNAAGDLVTIGGTAATSTSGQVNTLRVVAKYNEASGSAANTDIRVERTETAFGSGPQLFLDCLLANVSQFKVDHVGTITTLGGITVAKAFVETPVALNVSAGHVATNAALGNIFDINGTGNFQLDNPTNPSNGQKVMWRPQQNTAATITFDTAFDLAGQTITLTSGSTKIDLIGAIYDSRISKWCVLNPALGY